MLLILQELGSVLQELGVRPCFSCRVFKPGRTWVQHTPAHILLGRIDFTVRGQLPGLSFFRAPQFSGHGCSAYALVLAVLQ
jgi:hypothetical protein